MFTRQYGYQKTKISLEVREAVFLSPTVIGGKVVFSYSIQYFHLSFSNLLHNNNNNNNNNNNKHPKEVPGNYRPVSLAPVRLQKVMEQVVLETVQDK